MLENARFALHGNLFPPDHPNIFCGLESNLDSIIELIIHLYDIEINKECYNILKLAINGNDIIRFYKSKNKKIKGEDIGKILESLTIKVIQNECKNTKQELLDILCEAVDIFSEK